MDVDLLSSEAMADHTVVTRALLDAEPVVYYEKFKPPFFIVSRYRDIEEVLRKPAIFVSGQGQGPNFIEPAGVVSDAPDGFRIPPFLFWGRCKQPVRNPNQPCNSAEAH